LHLLFPLLFAMLRGRLPAFLSLLVGSFCVLNTTDERHGFEAGQDRKGEFSQLACSGGRLYHCRFWDGLMLSVLLCFLFQHPHARTALHMY
jgi:hypothetical protein